MCVCVCFGYFLQDIWRNARFRGAAIRMNLYSQGQLAGTFSAPVGRGRK